MRSEILTHRSGALCTSRSSRRRSKRWVKPPIPQVATHSQTIYRGLGPMPTAIEGEISDLTVVQLTTRSFHGAKFRSCSYRCDIRGWT